MIYNSERLSLEPGAIGLVEIEPDDCEQFVRMFQQKPELSYGDAWTYIAQAVNGYALSLPRLGYKIHEVGFLSAVGFFRRPVDGQMCAHIVNPLGHRRLSLTQELCGRIKEEFDIPVYLKKLDPDLFSHLWRTGWFRNGLTQPWHSVAQEEDDSYAELILDVGHSIGLTQEAKANDVKEKYNRFRRRTADREVAWRVLSELNVEDARGVIGQFFETKREMQIDISSPADYENMLVFPGYTKNRILLREVCYIDNEPAALLILDQIGISDSIGLYCNIALYQRYKYLSEFVIVRAIELAHENGIRYLHLGGSESEGLDLFKRKFEAFENRNWRRWLVW